MKKLLLLVAVFYITPLFCLTTVSAQEKEKVVTGTVKLMSPTDVQLLDEYMSAHLYTGARVFRGLNLKLGAIYRNQDNLSWDLSYTGFKQSSIFDGIGAGTDNNLNKLVDPSGSQFMKYKVSSLGYGTYYHWKFGRLMLKTGGIFDIYAGIKSATPDGVNNAMGFDVQMMIKGHAAVKYGWDFKKWALDIRGSISLPAFGLMAADHPSEPLHSILGNDHSALSSNFRHIFLASYHNYMSLDYDLGVDFVLKPCTLSLGFMSMNKRWNVYELQNIRKINCMTIGVSVDVEAHRKFKSSNKYF